MKKILGIGNALVDILIRIEGESLLGALNLPKGSMQLVNKERMDEILETLKDSPRRLAAGGSAANTIHGLAMLGVPTGFIGTIGRDELGSSFETDMVSAGTEPCLIRSDTETGRTITLITPDSERTFATYLGAAGELSAGDLAGLQTAIRSLQSAVRHDVITGASKEHQSQGANLFASYNYLHLEGFLVQDHRLVRTAIDLARSHGMVISLDLASYNVVEIHRAFLEEVIARDIDILFANEEEAKAFTGLEPRDALHQLAQFCEVVVVKTGSRGSLVKSGEVVSEIGILPVRPIDTTGAGDLYASGFLYGHLLGWPLQACGEAGALLAGHVIEELGAKMPVERWKKVKEKVRP